MSVVLLIRHGQASAGAEDYDVLSERGRRQAELVGAELRKLGMEPTRLLSGSLNRQRDTALLAAKGGGWTAPVEVDESWNEFDHGGVIASAGLRPGAADPLDQAIPRWSSGLHDEDYAESFSAFTDRVGRGFDRLVTQARGVVAVFTSAGAIAWIAAMLTAGGEPQWRALNRVAVNTGVTRIVVGRRGRTLVSYNEHLHLDPHSTTYR
ncbi:histidine phosphatase family protein [Nocardioides sp.]|uniref:histidine phosphatase family protein n=1 Tax=Nocardioides sp. TaxID=35761 RepID=UPI0039E6DF75